MTPSMRPSKPTLTLMILGLVGVLMGTAFKLNHLMGAERLFNAGMLALVIGLLSWVVSLIRKPKP